MGMGLAAKILKKFDMAPFLVTADATITNISLFRYHPLTGFRHYLTEPKEELGEKWCRAHKKGHLQMEVPFFD
jgi:hypothetical protein